MDASLSRAQSRAVDRIAEEGFGISGLVLMENAGLLAALEVLAEPGVARGRVAVVCGAGNNGGDGYVVARQLAIRGVALSVWTTRGPEELSGDALVQRRIVAAMRLPVADLRDPGALERARADWASSAVLVDALLGTGFEGAVREPLATVIALLNEVRGRGGPRVVSLDLPSGLDADTGRASNATVRADLTLTFVGKKRGFDAPGAGAWTGAVRVLPIGAPAEAVARALREA